MKKTLISAFLCLSAFAAYSQKIVEVKNNPSEYPMRIFIEIENCKTQDCKGKGTVTFSDKKTKKLIQSIAVQDLAIRFVEGQKEPLHQVDLSKDYNFDGEADLLITPIDAVLGQAAGAIYGGEHYIFDKVKKQFVMHQEFNKIGNKGKYGWQINKEKKRLEYVYETSATGYENIRGYEWSAKGELVLVYEAFQKTDETDIITTIRELKDGKWIEKVSREKF